MADAHTGMGPLTPAPKLNPHCQCICHTHPGVMHVAACCTAPDLIPRTDAEMAVAEAFRRAAEEAAAEGWPDEKRIGVSERDEAAMDCANRIETAILALAPAEALAEVQRLRHERDELRAAVEGLIAVLDRNDKKGPLPDVEMMFCWLAAQDVRAAFRKSAPKGETKAREKLMDTVRAAAIREGRDE